MIDTKEPEILQPIKPKHPGGRPSIWTDPQALESQINQYFDECDKGKEIQELNKRGEVVTYTGQIPYTMEGMADFLGTVGRTIRNYAKKDEFFPVISRARNKIRRSWLEHGLTGRYNPKMAALCLAAHDDTYRINQQHDLTIESMEDKLRRIQQQRLEHKPKPALPGPEQG